MSAATNTVRNGTGARALLRFLQREGHLSAADALRFEQMAMHDELSAQEVLEREGVIVEKDLASLLARSLRLPLVDLTSIAPEPHVVRAVKESIASTYGVVPLRLDDGLIEVATANPLDLEALKAVEFATGRRAQASVATRSDIRDALAHMYRFEESLEQFLQNVPPGESLTLTELRDEPTDLRKMARDAELPPVVKLADLILIDGIKGGASDVHIEPSSDGIAVRFRIDGILEESFRFPKWVQNPLTSRFKVMAKLDITERRVPQDGRIQVRYREGLIDLRVSSMPTHHGEKITLRILDASSNLRSLLNLGLNTGDVQRVRDAIGRPDGMILSTGPTGSGKTTTLYALIREVYSPSVNIVTIENPIEYHITGINQVEVDEKQGRSFSGILRSTLRQDPDVILIGEIRDAETAKIAAQAAQTGHLVLSTLHTNDAASTITRLLDLGVDPFVIASSLSLIIAQRLVRRVCPACSAPYEPADESRRLLRLADYRKEYRRGLGCPQCRQSGYRGRVGVFEVLPITPALAQLIESGAAQSAIRQQARSEGFSTLLEDSVTKLKSGATTAEEVLRVVQVAEMLPTCPSCGGEIDESFSVCPHCRAVLRPNCASCGKMLSSAWVTCPYCGGKSNGEPAAVEAAAAAVSPPALKEMPAPEPARSLKALVVDDDPDLRRIVRLTLEGAKLGLTVMTAQDGVEALELADIERPDIVVLDLSMPVMDGFEVCRRLRADMRTAFVPILMLTAKDGSQDVTKGFQVGTDDYLVKPVRREELIARIRRMLERTYGSDTVERSATMAATMAAAAEVRSSGTDG